MQALSTKTDELLEQMQQQDAKSVPAFVRMRLRIYGLKQQRTLKRFREECPWHLSHHMSDEDIMEFLMGVNASVTLPSGGTYEFRTNSAVTTRRKSTNGDAGVSSRISGAYEGVAEPSTRSAEASHRISVACGSTESSIGEVSLQHDEPCMPLIDDEDGCAPEAAQCRDDLPEAGSPEILGPAMPAPKAARQTPPPMPLLILKTNLRTSAHIAPGA